MTVSQFLNAVVQSWMAVVFRARSPIRWPAAPDWPLLVTFICEYPEKSVAGPGGHHPDPHPGLDAEFAQNLLPATQYARASRPHNTPSARPALFRLSLVEPQRSMPVLRQNGLPTCIIGELLCRQGVTGNAFRPYNWTTEGLRRKVAKPR